MFAFVTEYPSAKYRVVGASGVLARTATDLRLLSPGLGHSLWTLPHQGASAMVDEHGFLWTSQLAGTVCQRELATGALIKTVDVEPGLGYVSLRSDDVLFVERGNDHAGVSFDGRVLWRRESTLSAVVSTQDAFLLSEESGRRLACLDPHTGRERWAVDMVPPEWDADQARLQGLITGYPSVSCWGERIVVVRQFREILVLDRATGKLAAEAESPTPGHFAVTADYVYFFSGAGLSVFDHRSMQEVERINLKTEMAELYGAKPIMIRGFAVTLDAVVWTAPEGWLMAVERRPSLDGRRRSWRMDVGGVSPIAVGPTAYESYLYWNRTVVPPAQPAVLCFIAAPPGQ